MNTGGPNPFKTIGNKGTGFITALVVLILLNLAVYLVPYNLLELLGTKDNSRVNLINYAPEVWLSLLALVSGTLIIVISIAAESTPKVIDLFVGDYKSRLFIWSITLSGMENILLQLIQAKQTVFFDNLIFLNSYVLLPASVVLSIPYVFYILKYTKNSNVIDKIYEDNRKAIRTARKIVDSKTEIYQNQFNLFETVNQLHDLLQYVQFKEPKAEIIHKLGMSLRFYLHKKKMFSDAYFQLGSNIREDISFLTLAEKFSQIEQERTFYEHKVLRVLGTSYLSLMQDGHHDLASMCGNELCETGKTASGLLDAAAVSTVILHYNTLLRQGINHGLKTKEIKYVYDTIYHYSEFVGYLLDKKEADRIRECSRYFAFYRNEVNRLSRSESFLAFLVDAFTTELKSVLTRLHHDGFPRELQMVILKMFNELQTKENKGIQSRRDGFRLIQINLCLYYMENNEQQFSEIIIDNMIRDLSDLDANTAKKTITLDCELLKDETEEFWEDTDQGNRNIFYSPHKAQLSKFHSSFLVRLANAKI